MKKDSNLNWILYDLDGRRHAIRVYSWTCQPALPSGASNIHHAVAQLFDYARADDKQARSGFVEGYLESGGDETRLNELLDSIRTKRSMSTVTLDEGEW